MLGSPRSIEKVREINHSSEIALQLNEAEKDDEDDEIRINSSE